ncbi:MAG: class I SAM-dependent methyltransferase, partial [Candidatus Eiseniibacteriota bacterium]
SMARSAPAGPPGPPFSPRRSRGANSLARAPTRPPAATRRYWDRATLRWERFEPQLMYAMSAVDPTLLRALAPKPGQRVLDAGCGTGEPALAIAQWVAPRGSVLGLDLSPRMLAIARLRARQRGVTNVRFRPADLGRVRLPRARFHGVVSRFGLMFVEDIPGALGALRAALRPGGRAAFAVWGPMRKNPVSRLSAEAVRPFLEEPPPPPESGPHPLRLGRRGALASLMRQAGFRGVATQGVGAPYVYGSEEEFLTMNLSYPNPLRDVYLSLSPRDRRRLRARFARGIRRFRSGQVVRVPGFAWVVTGRR